MYIDAHHHSGYTTLKGIRYKILILMFCSTVTYGQAIESEQKELTVLIAKALIDVQNGKTIMDPVIYIRDGKIERLSTDLKIPKNSKLIDLSGKYILSGLVDAHTHLCHEYHYELETVSGSNTIAETVILSVFMT